MGLAQDKLDYEAAVRAGRLQEWYRGEWTPGQERPTDASAREGLGTAEMMRLRGD